MYVKAIETDNPLEFEWLVYLPSGFKKLAVIETIGGKFEKTRTLCFLNRFIASRDSRSR